MSKNLTATLILGFLGTIFLGIGLFFAIWVADSVKEEAARIEAMPVLSMARLSDTPRAQTVLIEGAVGVDNPVLHMSFVAYVAEELVSSSDDADWVEQNRETPPLMLDLPEGRVRVRNEGYDLSEAKIVRFDNNTRFIGLERQDPVLVLGTLGAADRYPNLDAEFIALGTKADYLAGLADSARSLRLIGGIFAGVGAIMLVVEIFLVWRLLR